MSRSTACILVAALLASLTLLPAGGLQAAPFARGDTDSSGTIDLTDAVHVLGFLFLGSPDALLCDDAADADDSGALQLTDAVYILSYLFLGSAQPPAPFPLCGDDPTPDALSCESMPACEEGPVLLRSELERDLDPAVEPGDLAELVWGNTAFALDLYDKVRGEDGNLFFSPLSISAALAMTYAGARGETERQMGETLRFTLPQERLHAAMNQLDLELEGRGEGAAGHDGGGFQLSVVNATWGQKGYAFLPGYLDVLALNYGAGLRLLDFILDPEGSRNTINDWVSGETAGRIEDLLPPGAVQVTTRLVLTNAIYFSAAWEEPFPIQMTEPGAFHLLDGSTATVPLMKHRWGYPYASLEGVQAVALPYDGGELSMVIILPAEGRFAEFEESLDASVLAGILDALRPSDVQVTLPRFSCEADLSLVQTLSSMGMTDAFAPGVADFSGMDGTRDLYVTGVLHKAFVAVDEYGTEAAAATAVVVGIVSIPWEFRADRPFLFLIRDDPTGTILFLGRVVSP